MSIAGSIPPVLQAATNLGGASPNWKDFALTIIRTYTTEEGRAAVGQFWEDVATRMIGTVMAYTLKWQVVAARLLMNAWTEAEAETGPVVAQLAALGLSDVFDVPISPGDVGPRLGANRTPLRNRIGQAVLDGIMSQAQVSGTLTPEDGVRAAEGVLGFSVGMATEGWIQGLYFNGPMGSYFGEQWQTLDDSVSAAAGLGSVARRAVGPVLRVLVAEPFTRWLNQQYRPRVYNEIQAERALRLGSITQAEYFDGMAELGWSREKAAVLDVVNSKQPEKEDLLKLRELALVDEAEMATLLRATGYTEDMSRILAKALQEDRVRSWRNATAGVVRDMYRDRDMTFAQAKSHLGELGYTDLETRTMLDLADLERNRPRPISESDMESAYIQGFASLGELHGYYQYRGYDSRSITILEQLATAKKVKAAK